MKNQSTEDYIKSIYRLQKEGKSVTTSELARHLQIGDGSVTDMLKKLSIRKLISYEPYRGVALTGAGRTLALKIVRRHRLWEMFLVKYLGYPWDAIHDEAERLEHVTSDELERRLDITLGFPKVDPHGDPIPNSSGEIEDDKCTALSHFSPGDSVRVVRVSDDDPAVLKHVAGIGLALNHSLVVTKKMEFDGSMSVKVGTEEHFVSSKLAEHIFVQQE